MTCLYDEEDEDKYARSCTCFATSNSSRRGCLSTRGDRSDSINNVIECLCEDEDMHPRRSIKDKSKSCHNGIFAVRIDLELEVTVCALMVRATMRHVPIQEASDRFDRIEQEFLVGGYRSTAVEEEAKNKKMNVLGTNTLLRKEHQGVGSTSVTEPDMRNFDLGHSYYALWEVPREVGILGAPRSKRQQKLESQSDKAEEQNSGKQEASPWHFSDIEEIALLKRSVGHKEYLMGLLRTELEKVKEEKEGFEFKIAKFEKSAKDLDQLLASQITDKSKKGFGYNVVPSPHPLILNRPTPLDLSYSGLEEFKQPEVNEYGPRDSSVKPTTGCDKESDNSKENTDDSLKQQQKTDSSSVKSPLKVDKDWKENFFCPANHVREEEPKKARENNDAPIIEDWVSDDEDDVEPIPKVEKKTVIPTATKKEFVKPEKPVRRSVSCPKTSHSSAHKHMAPRAVLMKSGLKTVNTARPVNTVRSVNTGRPFSTARQNVNTVRARGFNAVKPSACWVWRPIKPNGASLSNSQLNDKGFVDSGCSRHMTGNIAHLSDFKDFDGGYVTFGGGAYGGRINTASYN
ncbi:hypothetical protein Tco_0300148 [Tanacetum coccineum]